MARSDRKSMGETTKEAIEALLAGVKHPTFEAPMMQLGALRLKGLEGRKLLLEATLHGGSERLQAQVRERVQAALGDAPVDVRIEWRVVVPRRAAGGDDPVPDVRNVILVMSGKGGVGKSTTAVNLALALQRMGARVGLLDADIYGPSIPTMFGVSESPHSKDGKRIEPLQRFGVKLMSIGFMLESDRDAVIWRGPMLQSALMQFLGDVAWDELDYLVLDLPPGTGDVALSLAQRLKSTGAVMVTTPQEVALQDVYKAVSMCKKLNVPLLGIVENMSYFLDSVGARHEIFGSGGGQKVAEFAGAPLLGQVPLDAGVREQGDEGVPIVQAAPNHEVAQAFIAIADALVDQIARESFERGGGKVAPDGNAPRRLRILR
ncbi:MAG: Mrp/NBP35 family ATP-binding protein [Myxococcales bacterium]|nr:Mrp/NBP35 family ATP-binding protein [Myxococcales bacterium]